MDDPSLAQRYERLQLLYQVSTVIHSTLDPQEALELILGEAVRLTRASSGSIALINPTSGCLEIEAARGLPENAPQLRLRVGEGITGWVARKGVSARVGQVQEDPRYVMLKPTVRSELAVPLEVQGEIRGVVNVDSVQPDAFTADDQELLEALAVQAARVIHHTWLYEQIRLKARLFETLSRVGQTINSALHLDEALHLITREACTLMDARMSSLLLLDETGEWLDLRASHGAGPAYLNKPRLSVEESFLGTVARRKKTMQIENVQNSNYYQHVTVAREEGLIALLAAPLIFAGESIGTLNVYKNYDHSFSNEEIRILGALADLSAIAIEKTRLYERLLRVEEQLRNNEKLSALGLLAAEVAHEIRNPLTVMKMMYHSLDLKYPASDPRATDARILGEKMDHMNRIVEKVLDFARGSEPRFAPVDVNALIEDLTLLTRHKLKHHRVEWERRLATDLPEISADATQLEQVFLNLTLNAVEAMPHGGQLIITTRALRVPRRSELPTHVLIEFRDNGEGMEAEVRARLFTSILNSTKAHGTGLGLAIVHRVVDIHRGRLKVFSRPGSGTAIQLILPV